MKYLIFILLLSCVCSCRNPPKDLALQTVTKEIERMIDAGFFTQEYVVIYKFVSGKKGTVYWVFNNNTPLYHSDWMPPTHILPYKDKYICITNPFSDKLMSKKDLEEKCGYKPDLNQEAIGQMMYHIGVAENGKKLTVLSIERNGRNSLRSYMYPSLLEYIFDGYGANETPRFISMGFDIKVDSTFRAGDELDRHITQLYNGEIFVFNPHDICLTNGLDDVAKHGFFATTHGNDTLRYIVNGCFGSHLIVDTEINPLFFQNLPSDSTVEFLYQLIKDSTFYIELNNGLPMKTPIPYFDGDLWHNVRNDSCEIMTLYKKGVNEWVRGLNGFAKWN